MLTMLQTLPSEEAVHKFMSLSRLVGQLSRAQQYMARLAVPESFSRGSWSPSPLFSHLQLPWQDHLTFTVSREERRLSHQRWCSVLNVWVLVPKCVWAVLHLPSHTLKWRIVFSSLSHMSSWQDTHLEISSFLVRLQVLTVAGIKHRIFWDVLPCS
jgi:hypothetical protein